MVYSNGRTQHTRTITYTLIPRSVGSFTIFKAEITTQNNKVLYSEPFKIKVVKSGSSTASTSKANQIKDKVFLKTVVSNKKPVIGEQVTIDYRIYTQVSIEQYQITKEPDFSRFWRPLHTRNRSESKNRNNQWTSIFICDSAKSGVVSKSRRKPDSRSMIMDVGVPVNGRRSMFNPFYQIEAYTLKSEKITLDVQLLNQPADYSGIVGSYSMQVNYSTPEITSDDVIQLKIKISGKGDIKQVTAPEIGVDKQFFDFLEPQVSEKYEKMDSYMDGEILPM